MNPDLFYAYIYYDPSRDNEPIYVGKGNKNRVWRHNYRKGMHPFTQRLNFMKKNNIKPVIGIYSGLDEELALLLEEELIAKFGRKDLGLGSLLNLTNGGQGTKGASRKFTDEHRHNLSISSIGRKKSEDAKANMSRAKIGKPNGRKGIYRHSEEAKQSMRKPKSEEGRKNILAGAKHRAPVTEEAKKNRSAGRTGLHYPVIECPHCGKRGGSATMPRWHFDRCKFKGNKEND